MNSKPLPEPRRVVVLGALSAMAEATCRILAAEGAELALVARDERRLADVADDLKVRGATRVVTRVLDLAAVDDAPAVLDAISAELGGMDDVLLFYGVLGDQAAAEKEWAEARRIIDVNFTSAAQWLLAAAAKLDAQTSRCRGSIIVISSVAGDRGRRSNYVYGAAKGAISTLAQGLAHRFAATRGPRVVTMKVGFVDTPMTDGLPKGGPLWATPDDIAISVRRAMDRGGPIVYAPWFWRWIMLVIRTLPNFIFGRINI